MAETQKEKEDRLRREAEAKARTGGDSSFVAVNTLPRKETITTATGMKETARTEASSTTEKIGEALHEAKEDVKAAVTPGQTETERQRMEDERRRAALGTTAAVGTAAGVGKAMAKTGETGVTGEETSRPGTIPPPTRTTSTTTTGTPRGADWDKIQHPGMEPCDEDPYGTRPVSELTKPSEVTDKADLAAVRMMEREKADREQMDRERIMSTATTEAAAARAALASKEMTPVESEAERMRMKPDAGEGMEPAGTQGQHWRGEPWAKNPKVGGKETAEAEAEAARGRMMTGPAVAGAATMTPAEIEAERERTKTGAAATGAAVATGAAATRPETEAERERRMKTGAVVGGAALAAGAAATRASHEAGERPVTGPAAPPTTTTPTTRIRPMPTPTATTTTTTTMPPRGTETVDERARRHAEDPSVHPDWETQPQINAPMDVGIPTGEGQADAARIRAGRRRSDEAKEPRMERRGDEVKPDVMSSASDKGVVGTMKETARDVTEKTKDTARNVKEDIDRKI